MYSMAETKDTEMFYKLTGLVQALCAQLVGVSAGTQAAI